MANVNFEDLLSKLNFSNPIDGEDLLKWILGNVDPIIFSNNIRDNMINPLLYKLEDLYAEIGKESDALQADGKRVKKLAEPLGLTEISEDPKYKKQVISKFSPLVKQFGDMYKKVSEKIAGTTPEKIAAMADPSGILEVRKDHKKKLKDMLDKNLSNISPDTVEKTPAIVPEASAEQSSIAGKHKIDLSDETMDKFGRIAHDMFEAFSSELKLSKVGQHNTGDATSFMKTATQDSGWISWFTGLLIKVGLALLVSGGALVMGTFFWDSHLKPWLEKNIGMRLAFLDKYKGAAQATGKAAMQLGVGSFGYSGKLLKMFGEGGERAIEKVFGSLFGEAAEKGMASGAFKLFSGATLSKMTGKLLGKLSKPFLKAIPGIGLIFSFGFAASDFANGDTVSGWMNIASGLANLLNLVLPGSGTVVSLGIDVLNGILDYQGGEGTTAEKQARKINVLKDWGNQLLLILKKVPFLETFVDLGQGFGKIGAGDYRGGLEQLNNVPLLGNIIGPVMAILDNVETDKDSALGFKVNFKGLMKDMQKRLLRSILGWFPSAFGFRAKIAELMGVGDMFQQDKWESENSDITSSRANIVHQVKSANYDPAAEKRYQAMVQSYEKELDSAKDKNADIKGYLSSELEHYKNLLEIEKSKNGPNDSLLNTSPENHVSDRPRGSSIADDLTGKTMNVMGVGDMFQQDKWESENSDITSSRANYDPAAEKQYQAMVQSYEKELDSAKDKNADTKGYLSSELEHYKNLLEIEKSKNGPNDSLLNTSPENHVSDRPRGSSIADDFTGKTMNVMNAFIPSAETVFDPATNTKYNLAPDDNVVAYKSDGVFDKTLTEIKNVVLVMGKNIAELQKTLAAQVPAIHSTNVNNVSNNSGGGGAMTGKRDAIFDARSDYWRKHPQERSFI